jgi:hypothetical protein
LREFWENAFYFDEWELLRLGGEAVPAVHAVAVLDVDDIGHCNVVKARASASDLLHPYAETPVESALDAVAKELAVASVAHGAQDAHLGHAPDVGADSYMEEPDLLGLVVHDVEGVGGNAVVLVLQDAVLDELREVRADDVVAAELHEVRAPLAPLVDDVARACVKLGADARVVLAQVLPALALGHVFGPLLIPDDQDAAVDAVLLQLAQNALEAFAGDLSHFLPFVDGEHDRERASHFLPCFLPLSRRLGTM